MSHPNGAGMVFTVRQLELGDEEFARDIGMVEADLDRLAMLVNASSGTRQES